MRRSLRVALILLVAAIAIEVAAWLYVTQFAGDESFRRFASTAQLRSRFGAPARFQAHRHLGYGLTPDYRHANASHDARGFRGPAVPVQRTDGVLRIACLGGSTTYGWGVRDDDRLTYPAVLQAALAHVGTRAEVINAGVPGWTMLESLIAFQTRVLEMQPDVVLVYSAMNPVLSRMVWPSTEYRGDLSGWLARTEPVRRAHGWESSNAIRTLLVATGAIEPHGSMRRVIGDAPESSRMFAFQQQRRDGRYPTAVFSDVPIERMLDANPPRYFESELRSVIAIARSRGIDVVLQTFAYSKQFTDRPYIGHPAVQAAIDETNELVRRIASETGCALVDIARRLPDDAKLFTDGMHFTSDGNVARVALLLPMIRKRAQARAR